MGTQSKKIDKTKAKDKKRVFNLFFKRFALTWVFVVFNPFFIFIASCWIIFFNLYYIIMLASIISILRVFVLLFNTPLFIFAFLPVSFLGYFILQAYVKNPLFPKLWLVLASLFFYAFWNVKYLPLLVGSIIFNYFVALKIHQKPNAYKRLWLILGLIANVSLLGFFKYTDFFLTNFNLILKSHFETLHLILPLAISFFTLQQIAYLMDAYKQNQTQTAQNERERE